MPSIYLNDGNAKHFDSLPTGLELVASISQGLLKEAVAIQVNDELWDLTRILPENARVNVITRSSEEGLDILRHDAAHVLAEAVKELYPHVQVTIGPSIDNGFYYDFYKQEPFSLEELEKIEKRMMDIVDRDEPITRDVWSKEKAIAYFKSIGEDFKAEIVNDLDVETVTIYTQGNFTDLCRGPHLPSTKRLGKAFKLMSVAGAYWRGDSNNPMLQRIYGTAWANEKQLKQYLHMLEEAAKRDHRKLGTQMNLFHMQEEAPGSVFWHDKGWTLYRILENYIREKLTHHRYKEVKTPQLVDRSLWEKSGHWDKFGETNMFTVQTAEDKTMAVKPMNCPCHVQIFKQGIKSYRDLPLRMAEFGSCHRNEPSGSLHGLMRVRAFVQDDAHIFCTKEQITEETKAFCGMLKEVYKELGFDKIKIKFSDRPKKRAGDDATWDQTEAALEEAAKASGLDYTLNPGEGAFYGPKLEFVLTDALNRDWQCGTIQVDSVLPERLDASYVGEDGHKHRPVMLHRAILGSFERFIGILIEHYAGNFPLWLAPTQICLATITSNADGYAKEIQKKLELCGLRVITDTRNEKISYKIREHSHNKIPLILSLGQKEMDHQTVSIRRLGSTEQRFGVPVDDFIKEITEEIQKKGRMEGVL
jgi:threonyl-tRNA synthetase